MTVAEVHYEYQQFLGEIFIVSISLLGGGGGWGPRKGSLVRLVNGHNNKQTKCKTFIDSS